VGWKQQIETEHFADPGSDAKAYMSELRKIEKESGLSQTFSFDISYADFEIYNVLIEETVMSLVYATITVVVVVLFITFNI